ncbi:MAG: tail-specific protease [Bdellovibrionales bacterium CG12_big_fil_rev_8_21_14_0_65_38_15]|nr:MAG: tail-specific protease [Bdellovibrionales bacterium CG22_combo_CG10-13_8_21_14_all_38_13]PIQ54024.1 MAG: tail-specific protease [Bdellovibrionales bacterium CG12_big_fil_rev_8_21_14_0_65_38_15]PIR28549.1 MAG: tail-specific protease [Bdellovibrionales bacterium CG11_big_fil_rev_8_21_14_0_20_38_13]
MSISRSILFLLLVPALSFGQGSSPKQSISEAQKDKLVGNILKNTLETYHYKKLKINDGLSSMAFDKFLEKIDYSKQFLTRTDVDSLSKYRKQLDDEMVSGNVEISNAAAAILKKRVAQIEGFRDDFFKKPFDFTDDETLEMDPKKREWTKNDKQLKELWRKIFKNSVLGNYLALRDTAQDKDKKKDDKKAKKKKEEKKLTDKEMLAKAHKTTSEKYDKIFSRLKKQDREDTLESFYNSITEVFDPHTSYLPPKRKEDFDIDISGQLEGIGAVLQEDGSQIKVVKIVPGGAAWRQKELEVEDVIMSVSEGDGEPVSLLDMSVDDAVRYIRGKKGTEVRLSVRKADGSRKIVPIVRDVVQIDASYARSSVIEHPKLKGKVGYIKLPKFYRDFGDVDRNCTNDVRDELRRLKAEKVDSIILDLRDNGGGALEDARQMSGLFIEKGPIVQVRDHENDVSVLEDTDPTVEWDGPLIVLVNRFSASASEILAGAMQDYGRAVIVGSEQTHGKGTVQVLLSLNQGPLTMFAPQMGALKVTIQKFYRVNGESTQFKGIRPDIVMPDVFSYTKSLEQDLENALEYDTISPQAYKKWDKFKTDIPNLKKLSMERSKNNDRLNAMLDYAKVLEKKNKETATSLKMDKVLEQDKNNDVLAKKFKFDEANKEIKISAFEASIKSHQNIKPGDEKQWKEDLKQRGDEWIEVLQKDAILEEALYISEDLTNAVSKSSLSMMSK